MRKTLLASVAALALFAAAPALAAHHDNTDQSGDQTGNTHSSGDSGGHHDATAGGGSTGTGTGGGHAGGTSHDTGGAASGGGHHDAAAGGGSTGVGGGHAGKDNTGGAASGGGHHDQDLINGAASGAGHHDKNNTGGAASGGGHHDQDLLNGATAGGGHRDKNNTGGAASGGGHSDTLKPTVGGDNGKGHEDSRRHDDTSIIFGIGGHGDRAAHGNDHGNGRGRNNDTTIIFGVGGHGFGAKADWGHSRHNSAFDSYRHASRARHHYHAGSYHRPHGWYYRSWNYGDFLPALFFGQDYWIDDYEDYDLTDPPDGAVWVRYGSDALLVDDETGEIIQVVYGIFY